MREALPVCLQIDDPPELPTDRKRRVASESSVSIPTPSFALLVQSVTETPPLVPLSVITTPKATLLIASTPTIIFVKIGGAINTFVEIGAFSICKHVLTTWMHCDKSLNKTRQQPLLLLLATYSSASCKGGLSSFQDRYTNTICKESTSKFQIT